LALCVAALDNTSRRMARSAFTCRERNSSVKMPAMMPIRPSMILAGSVTVVPGIAPTNKKFNRSPRMLKASSSSQTKNRKAAVLIALRI